jgi:hypothetical protein
LNKLKNYHLDLMLSFIGYDDKESSKHSRYVGYIQDAIKKLSDSIKKDSEKDSFAKEVRES